MDIQAIKTFIQVAKSESFLKAAQDLNYAQSTVTMQMQKLEKELGFPLFERIGRKNHITIAGKEFLVYAEKILNLTKRASIIGQDLKSMKGIIRIGILESLLFSRLLSVISVFSNNFPNLEINIKIGQTVELKELLKQNKLDVIYVSTDANVDPSLKCCLQNKEKLVFVASKTHPLAKSNKVSAQEIFDYPFIITEPTGFCYKLLSKISAQNNCTLSHSVVVDSVAAIKNLLPVVQSIAFLPEYSLNKSTDSNQLTVISTDITPQIYYSQFLCTRDKWISPFIEELILEIKKSYK